MKIGFYQFSPDFGNIQKNREKMYSALKNKRADIIVLPELATSGYFFTSHKEIEDLSEPVPGPTTDKFSALSGKTGTHFVIGIPEKTGTGIYNSAVMIGPDGIELVYRKAHLFSEEKMYFTPGNSFDSIEINGVQIGLLVCFDHMFPEAARTLALKGVQIICHPSNLVLPEYGQLTTRVRALENKVFWVLANRFGKETKGERKLTYTGESQIVSPSGEVLYRAPSGKEEFFLLDIEPEKALNKNITNLNNLFKDRRTELYSL